MRWWQRLTQRTNPQPEPEKTYLGAFATTVDRARTNGLHTIAITSIGDLNSEFQSIVEWCRAHGCQLIWDRVIWDHWHQCWTNNAIAGGDMLFVLTADRDTATLARLTWA
jgi:hypothetical protein